jgi:hypothetical protein
MSGILFLAGLCLVAIGVMRIMEGMAISRAVKNGRVGVRHGMSLHGDKLVGLVTDVYRDPKSGAVFYGETRIESE